MPIIDAKAIPSWARVAFAARCARRVQAFYSGPNADVLEKSIRYAEEAAAMGDCPKGSYMSSDEARVVARQEAITSLSWLAAICAAEAANAAGWPLIVRDRKYDQKAVTTFCEVIERIARDAGDVVSHETIAADFTMIREISDRDRWNDESPIPKDVLYPIGKASQNCWFCKGRDADPESGVKQAMYGNVRHRFRQIPGQFEKKVKECGEEAVVAALLEKFDKHIIKDTLGADIITTCDTGTITVPRCKKCEEAHAEVRSVLPLSSVVGGLASGVTAGVVFALSLPGAAAVPALVICAALGLLGGCIRASVVAGHRCKEILRGILAEDDVRGAPEIRWLLKHHWQLGNSPRW